MLAQGDLTNGGNHDGMIFPAGDSDTWSFTASSGENIILRVGVPGSSFQPRITLFGPDASQLVTTFGNGAIGIFVQATNSGAFTLVVRANGDINTGGYRLYFARMPGSFVVADDGGALTNGGNYDAEIELGDLDLWSFDAVAGENVIVHVGELTSTGIFAPQVVVYGPDGQVMAGGSDWGNRAAGVRVEIATTGPHTVLVFDHSGNSTGTYRLYFAKLPGPFLVSDEGGALTNGGNHEGTIQLGDLDLWSFQASAGDSIVARIGLLTVTNLFGSFFWLFGPDVQLVGTASDSVRAAGLTTRATNSGIFTIVVKDRNADDEGTGNYRLHLAKIPGPYIVADEGGWLTNGVSVSASNHLGDLDPYSFWASAGNTITARVDKITGGTPYRPFAQLYSPTGIPLQSDSDGNTVQLIHNATNSGAFRVIVGDANAATNGTYTLLVTGATTPPTLPPPVLNIANAAPGFVTLWWPSNYLGFALETTPQLSAPAWGEIGVTKTNVGTNTTATVPVEADNHFFRLSGP